MTPLFADIIRARASDGAVGLRFGESSWTWREVVAEASAVARYLCAIPPNPDRGGSRGQHHVGVLMDNIPEYVFWLAGASLAGAALVGLNSSRAAPEIAADLEHADVDVVIVEEHLLPLLAEARLAEDRVLVVGTAVYERALAPHRGAGVPDVAVAPDAHAMLMFSSGTTGTPKAVIVSQARLGGLGTAMSERVRLGRESVTYLCMPLFHGNAVMMNLVPAMAVGATVCLARRFTASGFSRDVHAYGASYVNYVGRALSYVLAQPADPRDAASSLELAYGTEASEADIRAFAERFGCEVMEGYGLSEGVFRIARTPDTPPGALGLPQQGTDVRILDESTGRECPRARFDENGRLVTPDAVGQLVAVGRASAFEGYYRNPAAEADRVRGDDFWSGDLGYRDEAGWFYFAGRSSDWLRVDSENFAAAQVERVIQRMPQVRSAAVFAVPDARTGDQVMCVVEPSAPEGFDLAELGPFLDGQPDMGSKWWPRYLRAVEALPLTGSGKVDKAPLRAAAWGVPGIWVRVGRTSSYVPLDEPVRTALAEEFRRHARASLLPPPSRCTGEGGAPASRPR